MSSDGILLVDKPEGVSSARVVAIVKRRIQVKKVGHTGTLDPFATGLLPIAVGKGTRLSRFYLGGNKSYLATVKLGQTTDTYDNTGNVLQSASPETMAALDPEKVREEVARFLGPQEQVPPAFSALKHKGVPLYKLARKGEMVTKPPRQIEIFEISITRMALPEVDIRVRCTGGTYIRSIAHDLGERLGCGAHLSALRRTASSHFEIHQAISLDRIEQMDAPTLRDHVIPPSACLPDLPKLVVDADTEKKISHGQPLEVESIGRVAQEGVEFIGLTDSGDRLLALVTLNPNGLTYNYCCVFIS